MSATTVKLSEADRENIRALKDQWNVRSQSDVIRRSVSSARMLSKLADKDGLITIIREEDGQLIKVPAGEVLFSK